MKRLVATLVVVLLVGPVGTAVGTDVPDGFHLQILQPTGGRIARPDGWHYVERHGATTYRWILALEDPDAGPYQTGVSLQMLPGVTEPTGLAPEAFVRSFIEHKRASAEPLAECAAVSGDLLDSMCLEVLETVARDDGKEEVHRIRYALYWGRQNLDLVIVMVAGTTRDLWEQYAPIFDVMGEFRVLDLSRRPTAALDDALPPAE